MPTGRLLSHAMILVLALAATPATSASAADPPGSPPAPASTPVPKETPAAKCAYPEARQFDFWIGHWDVHSADGSFAGTNRIEPILGGCVLQENWNGAGGMSGTSLNAFDPATRRWHQTWMDDSGTLLLLDGVFADGKMVLSGDTPSKRMPGTTVRNRITWSPLPGGKVRQLWEASTDGGGAWTVVFDGTYTRKP